MDTATTMGRALRRWLLAAMVTGVSAMLWESFARVFPVQGAMTRASSSFLGPMGSAWAMVVRGARPQISSAFARNSSGVPKRLETLSTAWEKMGITWYSSDSFFMTGNRLEKVQNEPHIAKPMVILPPPSQAAEGFRR